jgi:hypothetical protein
MPSRSSIELQGPADPAFDQVLTPDALEFVAELQRQFGGRRQELLEARVQRRARLAGGESLGFLLGGGPRASATGPALGGDHRAHGPQAGHQRPELRG